MSIERRGQEVAGIGLGELRERLASTVARQWRKEEGRLKVRDPFPLTVRFRNANTPLLDHWAKIRNAPPGADPGPLELDGGLDQIVEVYRSIPSRRLVVLGGAGSGKTVLAMRFVLDWLSDHTSVGAVPVIFRLGSWDPTAVSLGDWMVDQLVRDYGFAAQPALGRNLVDTGWIVPVLDGFDEMADGMRCTALEALNATNQPFLLTSRPSEYADAVVSTGGVLTAAAAVELTDLSIGNLAAYLLHGCRPGADGDRYRPVWEPVLHELSQQPRSLGAENVAKVLTTPLMVALARTIYSDTPDRPTELLDTHRFATPEALERHLLAAFTPAAYMTSSAGSRRHRRWDPHHAKYWLGYLAAHLERLDRLDLAWWQLGTTMRRSSRMLVVGFLAALAFGVTTGIEVLVATSNGLGFTIVRALMVGLLPGLVAGIIFGLGYGFVSRRGPVEPSIVHIRIFDRHAEKWTKFARGFMLGIGLGVPIALLLQLVGKFSINEGIRLGDGRVSEIVFVPETGLGAGLVLGIMAWLKPPIDIRSAVSPSRLLNVNRRNSFFQMLVWLLTLGLLSGLGKGFIAGPLSGLLTGIEFGIGGAFGVGLSLTAWGQWVALARTWLPLTGRLPWALPAFLDDACQRGVLRQAGAHYQFRCARLQDVLAEQYRLDLWGSLDGTHQPAASDQHDEEDVKDDGMAFLKRMPPWAILFGIVALLLIISWVGTRDILETLQNHGTLGPSDAPIVVTTIVSLATAIGALIGGTLTGIAKYVQARGQADADRTRADADMLRAQADFIRARASLPSPETPPDGEAAPRQPEPLE
ncbi:NACHT domain-containing protein [Streptomyces sp. NPDC056975]|uniref:NACHT domain-containing protein n=1 Tax=Streptomyces sp. NPDC056975 TaxID=3345985 RepID=UPI00363EE264